MPTTIFDATDIDYLALFTISELRAEIKNAWNKLKCENDWHWQMYYEDFIKACHLAIRISELLEPAIKPTLRNIQPRFESADTIKERYDLVDYIGQYVQLKKVNNKYQGLCPFHPDKHSPSLVVYPDQHWHCFGCQRNGTVIDFVMIYEGLTLKEALCKLSR
jgi:hypothetical protein